jgi:hypothetical protein
MKDLLHLTLLAFTAVAASATEFHIAITGSDASPGTPAAPLRTIQRAADLAQPGDTVTVHAGVYRERVNPPRGGESDTKRIVYQAATGEQVVITGSEEVKNWEKVQDGVWKATLPTSISWRGGLRQNKLMRVKQIECRDVRRCCRRCDNHCIILNDCPVAGCYKGQNCE